MQVITINGKQYNLELKAKMVETVELCLKSKKSILDIFMPVSVKPGKGKGDTEISELKYCSVGDMIRIFWGELQVNNTPGHVISFDEACDLYDEFMSSAEGRKMGVFGFYFLLGKAAHFFTAEVEETTETANV